MAASSDWSRSGSGTDTSISCRAFTPPESSRGPLNVRRPPSGVRRSRSSRPAAPSRPRSSSKSRLSSKWRARTRRAPSFATADRAASGPDARSLISLSTWPAKRACRGCGLLHHADGHLRPLLRVVARVAGLAHDLVRHLHATHHAAEGRVLPVEEGRVLHHDEEL